MVRLPTARKLLGRSKSDRIQHFCSREQISNILTLYSAEDIGRLVSFKRLAGWPEKYSLTMLLDTTTGRKVLKRYRYPNLAGILGEHSVLTFLAEQDFPAARLVANKEGLTFSEFEGHFWAVYDYIDGFNYTDFLYLTRHRSRFFLKEAARTLARYHHLVREFIPEGRKLEGFKQGGQELWRDTEWHLNVLEECQTRLSGKKALGEVDQLILNNLSWLRENYARLGEAYESDHSGLSKLVIHGDYAPNNILFDKEGLVAVLDFGSARLDVRVLDVAQALGTFARLRPSLLRGVGIDCEQARYFLSVYQACYPLKKREIEVMLDIWQLSKMRALIWAINKYTAKKSNDKPVHSQLQKRLQSRLKLFDWLAHNEGQLMATLSTVIND
jgi:Ser/Thr protein kinase RdoA (MazF antagonist)